MDPNLIKSIIVIHGNDDADLPELNLQASDDLEKLYEFEGKLRLKNVTTFIENNVSARHQYYLEIESIDKFKEED